MKTIRYFLATGSDLKFILLCALAYSAIIDACGQDKYFLSGIVVNQVTSEPVAFANVYLASENIIGTATDTAGIFILPAETLTADTLIISCIGYRTGKIPVASLSDTTYLIPTHTLLDEVAITARKISPVELLAKSFKVKDSLMRSSDFKLTVLYSGTGKINENDYALDILLDQYYFFSETGFAIDTDLRHARDRAANSSSQVNNILFELGTWNFYDYQFVCDLNEDKCRDALKINKQEVWPYKNRDVIKITYQIKPDNKFRVKAYGGRLLEENGEIFIDPDNYIILRHSIDILLATPKSRSYHPRNIRNNIHNHRLHFLRNYQFNQGNYIMTYYHLSRNDFLINSNKEIMPINSVHQLRTIAFDNNNPQAPHTVIVSPSQAPYDPQFWQKLDSTLLQKY